MMFVLEGLNSFELLSPPSFYSPPKRSLEDWKSIPEELKSISAMI
jgi:hypothetical protein